jgi:hypothetical protein
VVIDPVPPQVVRRERLRQYAAAAAPRIGDTPNLTVLMADDAAAVGGRVARLVYVCAGMPEAGESLGGLMAADPIPSEIGTAIRMADDGTATLDPDAARTIIFSDATRRDATRRDATRPGDGDALREGAQGVLRGRAACLHAAATCDVAPRTS